MPVYGPNDTIPGPTTPGIRLLFNHVSPESAYLVEDYPCGFRWRCKIRYWIEFKHGKGFRFVSQTTTPKRLNVPLSWNTPKRGTYCRFGMAMYLDDQGHVQSRGLTEYSTGKEAQAFMDTYGAAVPDAGKKTLAMWLHTKKAYDDARAANPEEAAKSLSYGLKESAKAFVEVMKDD